MINELHRHGYQISPGTLYPLFQRMEQHGWLRRKLGRHEMPRARKNYLLTREGRRILRLIRRHVNEMHRELIRELKGRPTRMTGHAMGLKTPSRGST
ncbi:MAG: PadR family transcriptional regulator [Terriglobia bacterium]